QPASDEKEVVERLYKVVAFKGDNSWYLWLCNSRLLMNMLLLH
ncbi:unnamed protein product, partial [Linum tenue]